MDADRAPNWCLAGSYPAAVNARDVVSELGLTGAAYAAPVHGGRGVGFCEHELVSPASVMKVQIALAVENLVAGGAVDGAARRSVPAGLRTPGPTGMADE